MLNINDINSLEILWEYTNSLHKLHYPKSKLEPIMAGGKSQNPRYMFVFINPTYRNVSSGIGWRGKRRPWTGTKYIWKIFNEAGHFDEDLLGEISSRQEWDLEFADKVYKHLEDRNFYFTNIVKWTGENADLPNSGQIKLFLPILLREIEIVQPEYIVTFGLIPFNALVEKKLKLGEYFESMIESGTLRHFTTKVNYKEYKVIPSYFPVGRGNPKRAVKILSMLP
jgi:hypothetical protein